MCASNCIGGSCSEDKDTGSYVCDSCANTDSSCFCTYTNGDTDTVDNPTGGNCSVFDSAEFNAVKMADIDGTSAGKRSRDPPNHPPSLKQCY